MMYHKLILRLNMAKINCGVPIPGINQTQHKELREDDNKLSEFLFVIPFTWSFIITFAISIYKLEEIAEYPIRLIFTIFCIFVCCLMMYVNDPSLYLNTKSDGKTITTFGDSNIVAMKVSMGFIMDINYELNKKYKQEHQQEIQKYIICLINFVILLISLLCKKISQIHSFERISWMLGCLADSIKSLQYKDYVKEFITLCETFEKHKYKTNNMIIPVGKIESVTFDMASFGYYDDDLTKNTSYNIKIFNLNYKFKTGIIYYLEAPNGIGKSTLLRMFKSNLHSGDVFFGTINRLNISAQDVNESVFHIVQASEYTPKFSRDELKLYKGKDEWLEKQLGIDNLFDKDTLEMSGGQKKRMFIYIVLTSRATVLLLDEILSELSTEEVPEVKEGGGWLNRVINTLIEWNTKKIK